MKKFIYTLILLFSTLSMYSQNIEVEAISFKGTVTTAQRNSLDVPDGKYILIFNVDNKQLEIGDEDEVWIPVSPAEGEFVSLINGYTGEVLLNLSLSGDELGLSGSGTTIDLSKYIQDASNVAVTPYGDSSVATVQEAIEELDGKISSIPSTTEWDDILHKPSNLDLDDTDEILLDGTRTMISDFNLGGNQLIRLKRAVFEDLDSDGDSWKLLEYESSGSEYDGDFSLSFGNGFSGTPMYMFSKDGIIRQDNHVPTKKYVDDAIADAVPSDIGDVFKVGTPSDNQVGVWTGDGLIEGDPNFTWDGNKFNLKASAIADVYTPFAKFTLPGASGEGIYGHVQIYQPGVEGLAGILLSTNSENWSLAARGNIRQGSFRLGINGDTGSLGSDTAFEVSRENFLITAPNVTTEAIDAGSSKVYVTKEWVQANAGSGSTDSGTGDLTLADVLSNGAIANTSIDMDGNYFYDVAGIRLKAGALGGGQLSITGESNDRYYFHKEDSAIGGVFDFSNLSSTSRNFIFPNKSGTVALLDDISEAGSGSAFDPSQNITFTGSTIFDNSYTQFVGSDIDFDTRVDLMGGAYIPDNAILDDTSAVNRKYVDDAITDDQTATEVPYDNTDSGLTATNVKSAIDEISGITGKTGVWTHLQHFNAGIQTPNIYFGQQYNESGYRWRWTDGFGNAQLQRNTAETTTVGGSYATLYAFNSTGVPTASYDVTTKDYVDTSISNASIGGGSGVIDRSNEKWVIFGDSFSSLGTDDYPYYVVQKLGMDLANAESHALSGNTLNNQNTVLDGLASDYFDDKDLVTLHIGVNDFATSQLIGNIDRTAAHDGYFVSEMKYFIETIQAANPEIEIYLITPIKIWQTTNKFDDPNNWGYVLKDYIQAMKDVAALYSLPVIDLYNNGKINDQNYVDYLDVQYVHPNSTYLPLISDIVADGLLSHNLNYQVTQEIDYSDIVKSKNLFNKETVTEGVFISNTTGALSSNATYNTSDFIPVEEGETYTPSTQIRFSCYFDANGDVVSGGISSNTDASFTVPAGAVSVRVTISVDYMNYFQLEKGTETTKLSDYWVLDPFYDNRSSGLSSKSMQGAIDELEANKITAGITNMGSDDFIIRSSGQVILDGNDWFNYIGLYPNGQARFYGGNQSGTKVTGITADSTSITTNLTNAQIDADPTSITTNQWVKNEIANISGVTSNAVTIGSDSDEQNITISIFEDKTSMDAATLTDSDIAFCTSCAPMEVQTTSSFDLNGNVGYDDRSTDAATFSFDNIMTGGEATIEIDRASEPTFSGATFIDHPNSDGFVADTEQVIYLTVLPSGRVLRLYSTIE